MRQRAGIVLPDTKAALVFRRLAPRVRELGLSSFAAYRERLWNPEDAEWDHVVGQLTTNHSRFFREIHHFKLLSDHLAEQMAPGNARVRLWSAACAGLSGAEYRRDLGAFFGSVHGTLVLAEGDVNLTFKRYLEKPVTLRIANDHIDAIEGQGLDADLMRSYIAAWGERAAYAVSHVGYGLNDAARWDSMALLDKRDFNGTELRAFAGNFLYSTGANEVAGRYTLGHFDLPLRNCTIALDDHVVVRDGQLT